tara:strand:+ start:2612 stop:2911 length:300 start_codon:yes stop_codon:yes gene_type:complete
MKKGYWISLYIKVNDQENLKKYAEIVTPIIKSFGGVPLVRGGKYQTFDGDNFNRTVIWEFPSYVKALECHDSKEYQAGWAIAKNTTLRHMQIVEGFNTE